MYETMFVVSGLKEPSIRTYFETIASRLPSGFEACLLSPDAWDIILVRETLTESYFQLDGYTGNSKIYSKNGDDKNLRDFANEMSELRVTIPFVNDHVCEQQRLDILKNKN